MSESFSFDPGRKSASVVWRASVPFKVFFLARNADIPAVRKAMGTDHRKPFTRGSHCEIALDLSHRYFAVTWQALGVDPDIAELVGGDDRLKPVSRADLLWLVNEAGPKFASNGKANRRDESASGALWQLACKIKRAGGTKADFEEAIADHPEAAAHVDKGGQRAIDRAWTRAPKPDDRAAKFADVDDDDFDDCEDILGWKIRRPKGDHVTDLDGFALNEDGVALAFEARHRNQLRFDHTAGKWFNWDGRAWSREETMLAFNWAREACRDLARLDPKNAQAKALAKSQAARGVESLARAARSFAVTADEWDRDPMLLGTPSGTVELTTGKLRTARQEDRITKLTAVGPVPLDSFDPERDCPRWLRFLDEALAGDRGAIRLFQQWGGYSLTGETKEQVLFFVHGPGGSGKGTAINTIGDILGSYAINIGMETLTASKHDRHTTELARLKGARMARASETEKGRAWAENRIKNLTGQDTITARFMRQDDFEFRPAFKLTIFGNNRPSLKDVDSAIKRRFIVLPFDHPPAEKDADLAEKLKAEWPGILSWLILGCLDWQANGLVRPGVVEAATTAYFDEQDVFGQWLDEHCEIGAGVADTTEALWQSWQRYAYRLGEESGSKMRTFPETLSQRGFYPIKDSKGIRGRGFRGLRVRHDAAEDHASFL